MALKDMLDPVIIEAGKLKLGGLGEEKTSRYGKKYRMPVKYSSWMVTTLNRDESGSLIPDGTVMTALRKDYADVSGEVMSIPISLLSDKIEDVLRSFWVAYNGGVCMARSDGKVLTMYGDINTKQMYDEPKTFDWTEEFEKKEVNGKPLFKKHTTLDCVISIPEANWGGIYRFRTTSIISGDQLYGSLVHLSELTGGILVGLPLALVVRPIVVHPNGVKSIIHVAHIEPTGPNLHDIQNKALEISKYQSEQRAKVAELREGLSEVMHNPGDPEHESDDEQSELQQEFHPEPEQEEISTEGNAKRVLEAKFSVLGYTDEQKDEASKLYTGKSYEAASEFEADVKEIISKLNSQEPPSEQEESS